MSTKKSGWVSVLPILATVGGCMSPPTSDQLEAANRTAQQEFVKHSMQACGSRGDAASTAEAVGDIVGSMAPLTLVNSQDARRSYYMDGVQHSGIDHGVERALQEAAALRQLQTRGVVVCGRDPQLQHQPLGDKTELSPASALVAKAWVDGAQIVISTRDSNGRIAARLFRDIGQNGLSSGAAYGVEGVAASGFPRGDIMTETEGASGVPRVWRLIQSPAGSKLSEAVPKG